MSSDAGHFWAVANLGNWCYDAEIWRGLQDASQKISCDKTDIRAKLSLENISKKEASLSNIYDGVTENYPSKIGYGQG